MSASDSSTVGTPGHESRAKVDGAPAPIDPVQIRTCVGHFATGVTVITCEAEGETHGITANAFTSVSLDPPLVLVSLAQDSRAAGLVSERPFTINILSADQADHAWQFAGKPQEGIGLRWEAGAVGPRIAGSLAYIACRPWGEYPGGDHTLFLGEVAEVAIEERDPLVFYRGEFRLIGTPQEQLLVNADHGPCTGWWGDLPAFRLDPVQTR